MVSSKKVSNVSSPATAYKKQSLWEESARHQNCLSKRQMESLVAICDTLLPSMDPPLRDSDGSADDVDGVATFYRTSASMAGITERVGEIVSGGMIHPQMTLLRWALLLLSTWFGTLILCGRHSLSPRFPFVRRFAMLEQDKREKIIFSWTSSSFRHLRMMYTCIKCLTMRFYFSQVNAKQENPSWNAIGYCGPDPSLVDKSQSAIISHHESPVKSTLLHLNSPPEIISRKLHEAGFTSPTFTTLLSLHCDAVIIGSGSGGSVAAGVLAAAGHKILVIEKGDYYSPSELSLLEGPTCSAMYEGGGFAATDDVSMFVVAGATVGGGSTINWSASIPTPHSVRREWCDERRLELFGSEAYDLALEAVCRRLGVQSRVKEEGFNSAVLRRGCEAAGYDVADVPCNAPPDHYCGWCQFGCKDRKKKSALVTWLDDMARSGNGFILPGCRAVKILKVKGKKRPVAAGVVVEYSAGFQFTITSKVTIVACGALHTPRLLKRSGLRNGHIGKNIHLHPTVMAWGYFPESSDWPEKTKRSYEGGILTSMSRRPNGSNNVILQTPALHPGIYAALVPWVSAADFRLRMRRFARTAHIFALVRDEGSGAVDYPGNLTHQLGKEDEKGLKEGLEAAIRVLEAAGAEEVGTQWVGGDKGKGREGVERVVNGVRKRRIGDVRTPMSSAHQMGSCRMGVTEKVGAVRPDGEAWEVEGLFVVDTSIFPTALGVNPMVTVQAIAYCIAQNVDEVLRRKTVDHLSGALYL